MMLVVGLRWQNHGLFDGALRLVDLQQIIFFCLRILIKVNFGCGFRPENIFYFIDAKASEFLQLFSSSIFRHFSFLLEELFRKKVGCGDCWSYCL